MGKGESMAIFSMKRNGWMIATCASFIYLCLLIAKQIYYWCFCKMFSLDADIFFFFFFFFFFFYFFFLITILFVENE